MRLTRRVALLLLIGIVPLAFSGALRWLAWGVLGYDVLLVILVLADIALTPKGAYTVSRAVEDKLSLGVDNLVTLTARYQSETRLPYGARLRQLTVRDEPPVDFDSGRVATFILALSATHRDETISYHVRPPAKGDYEFGDTYIGYDGYFGLIRRVARIRTRQDVRVYPNLVETAKYDMLARSGRLMQVGIRNYRQRGEGSEFESLREYVPGDEYRKIDWAATARRHKLISRQYQVERAQNIVLVIDAGRNMLQKVGATAKIDYVINTALMLGYVASSSDDRVGLMVFDGEVRTFIPPGKGKTQVYRLLDALYNVSAVMVESDYDAAFKDLAARWRRRSLVVLFTDLVDTDSSAQMLSALSILERRHRVLCVTVSDPSIVASARDVPEEPADVFRKAVSVQVLQERRQAASVLKHRGIWTIDSPPESLSSDLINHYLALKARAGI
ncbi:MAG: DUF58 domain-containing protein [Capsulimonadaceae bacterium]|nr:DUF58 domain-containing protein [Capsulimonadaceae bacterium]